MNIKDKKKVIKTIGLICLFLLVIGLSYAIFTVTLNGTKKVKIKTGKLELQLLDENNNDITDANNAGYVINLDNQVPVDDETGLGTQAFEFKLKNNGTIDAKYTIYLDDVALESGETRLRDSAVMYSLTKNGGSGNPESLTTIGSNPNRKLDGGLIKKDETNIYTLRVWISRYANNSAMDKVFHATLRVEGSQYLSPFENNAPMADQLYAKDNVGTLTAPIQNGFRYETDESEGIYKYTDSKNTTTYVYRGNDLKNYVSFANQTWRILRIQEDGTVKLIRDQALNYENSTYDNGGNATYRYVKYNNSYDNDEDSKYSGSNVEAYVNAWYTSEMSEYDNMIEENTYCSDRYEPEEPSPLKQSDYQSYAHLYGILNRGKQVGDTYEWNPSISCSEEDEISAKAALITADEVVLAGSMGKFVWRASSIRHYLERSYLYWTMSPAGFNNGATAYGVSNANHDVGSMYVYLYSGVCPVITLKTNTSIASGNGTPKNPYIIN